jgi:CheY-like chemotaxis protein
MTGDVKIVLYVEDNLTNYRIVELALADWKEITLLGATTGEEGLRLAHEHLPSAILLDVHLPDIKGDEVLRRLKADPATANIPVLVLSADSTSIQMRQMLEVGAVNYLTKPLDLHRLLRALTLMLNQGE